MCHPCPSSRIARRFPGARACSPPHERRPARRAQLTAGPDQLPAAAQMEPARTPEIPPAAAAPPRPPKEPTPDWPPGAMPPALALPPPGAVPPKLDMPPLGVRRALRTNHFLRVRLARRTSSPLPSPAVKGPVRRTSHLCSNCHRWLRPGGRRPWPGPSRLAFVAPLPHPRRPCRVSRSERPFSKALRTSPPLWPAEAPPSWTPRSSLSWLERAP
mmetsp:Transcript_61129/g.186588  ORF Transcript_61129/g.186588 Transcript_61129/m.186588 type:complete len:215 (-) Transcript_61129:948-1592(-)